MIRASRTLAASMRRVSPPSVAAWSPPREAPPGRLNLLTRTRLADHLRSSSLAGTDIPPGLVGEPVVHTQSLPYASRNVVSGSTQLAIRLAGNENCGWRCRHQ